MTEGRHHRRRDDDHTADGIYFPPPREVPSPSPAAPSPWAPAAESPPPAAEPNPPSYYAPSSEWDDRSSPWAAADPDDDEEAGQVPAETLPPPPPAQEWLPPLYPQEWPPSTGPSEEWSPLPSLQDRRALDTPAELPQERESGVVAAPAVPMAENVWQRPQRGSTATSWWIATGVIIVALAIAAGVLVGLSLAQRS